MVNSSKFAQRLQKILAYYGLTATSFSEQIDFNRSTISHLLSGRNKPSLEFVMKVIEKFPEVELYWLLNGKGNFPADKKNKPTTLEKSVLLPENDYSPNMNENMLKKAEKESTIDRIVIFFEDGSFKSYEK